MLRSAAPMTGWRTARLAGSSRSERTCPSKWTSPANASVTDVGGRTVEDGAAGVGVAELPAARPTVGRSAGAAALLRASVGGEDVVQPTTARPTRTAVATSPTRPDERMRPSLPALPP